MRIRPCLLAGDLATRDVRPAYEEISWRLIREGLVGRDSVHATAASRGPLLFKYRAYASWGQGETPGATSTPPSAISPRTGP